MGPQLTDKIHAVLATELVRRLLVRYFHAKGFSESLDKAIYPPQLQDLIIQIPQLLNKVEVVPHVEDIDPQTGVAKLGWNLFVLGNRRMFLGESVHTSLAEVRMGIDCPASDMRRSLHVTPRKVIHFISTILGNNLDGDISQTPTNIVVRQNAFLPLGMGDQSGFFRMSGRPIR